MTPDPQRDARANLFVDRYIHSLDDLECLLLLVQTPDRWWNAETLGRQLHLPASYARDALERFAAGNLLAIRRSISRCREPRLPQQPWAHSSSVSRSGADE